MAGSKAAARSRKRISIVEINASMHDFTRYRLNDLYKEHIHQFSQIERLTNIFSGAKTKYSTDELSSKINKEFVGPLGVRNIAAIDGEPYNSPLQLASLLFQIGFLVARLGENSDAGSVDFIGYSERPELLKFGVPAETNLSWEIYPSYRVRPKQKVRRIGA